MSNRPRTVAHQCIYTRNELTAPLAYIRHDAAATIGRLSLGEDASGDPLTATAVEQRRRDMPAVWSCSCTRTARPCWPSA